MGFPLLMQTPQFQCKHYDYLLDKEYFKPCQEEAVCKLIRAGQLDDYITKGFQSINADFKLYCDRRYLLGWVSSVFFIGQSISAVIIAYFSNRFGRRNTIIFNILLASISVFIAAFSPTIYFFMFFTFLAGMGFSGFETVVLVYVSEISGIRFRNISTNVLFIMWATAQLGYTFFFTFFENSWNEVLMVIGVLLSLTLYTTFKYIWESPRYLVTNGRFNEARQVFRDMSIFNRRPPFEFKFLQEIGIYNGIPTKIQKRTDVKFNSRHENTDSVVGRFCQVIYQAFCENFFALLSTKWIFTTTVKLVCLWFIRYFCYFSIAFSLETLGSNIHKNFLILALAEIFSALFSTNQLKIFYIFYQNPKAPLQLQMNRKTSFKISFSIILVCSSVLFFIQIDAECYLNDKTCITEFFTLMMACFLKMAIIFFIVVLMTYTSEIYPTSVRSGGYSMCMMIGNIGSILAPLYINYMFMAYQYNPLRILSIMAAIGLFISCFLDETFGLEMDSGVNEKLVQKDEIHEQVQSEG